MLFKQLLHLILGCCLPKYLPTLFHVILAQSVKVFKLQVFAGVFTNYKFEI